MLRLLIQELRKINKCRWCPKTMYLTSKNDTLFDKIGNSNWKWLVKFIENHKDAWIVNTCLRYQFITIKLHRLIQQGTLFHYFSSHITSKCCQQKCTILWISWLRFLINGTQECCNIPKTTKSSFQCKIQIGCTFFMFYIKSRLLLLCDIYLV